MPCFRVRAPVLCVQCFFAHVPLSPWVPGTEHHQDLESGKRFDRSIWYVCEVRVPGVVTSLPSFTPSWCSLFLPCSLLSRDWIGTGFGIWDLGSGNLKSDFSALDRCRYGFFGYDSWLFLAIVIYLLFFPLLLLFIHIFDFIFGFLLL